MLPFFSDPSWEISGFIPEWPQSQTRPQVGEQVGEQSGQVSPVSNQAISGMRPEHREQLRAGAATRSDVEMLHAEVRVERVAPKPHALAECELLARGVGDSVAEASAA